MTKDVTKSIEIPVYEVALEDGTAVRFHDYETEDGGLRIQFKRLDRYGFPDRKGSDKKQFARPDPSTEVYRDALIPFAEMDGQCVSPIQVGTVVYKRDYEYERETSKGLIFTSTKYKYRSTSDTYVEFDDETLITTERNS
jgi:hypothetical protein